MPSALCQRPCRQNRRPPCRQSCCPGPSAHSAGPGWGTAVPPWVPTAWPCRRQRPWPSGHSPHHPEHPEALEAQMPTVPCSPPPTSRGHGAAGGGVSAHTPSGLRIPCLKAQAGPTFQGNALSPPTPFPAPTPTDRGRGCCLAPQLGSQHPDPSARSRSRWAAQGPSLRPQLGSRLAPRTGHRARGLGTQAGAARARQSRREPL